MVVIISLNSIHSDSVKLRANFKHPTKIQRLLHVQFFSIVVTGKDPPFEDVNVGNNVLSNVISEGRGWRSEFNYTIAHLSGKGYYFPWIIIL